MPHPQASLAADIKALLRRHRIFADFVKFLLGSVIGAVSMLVALHGYVRAWVDSAVAKRWEPYDHLLSGLTSNQGENFDDAVESLRDTINKMSASSLPVPTRNLMYDVFIYGVVNSDSPERFSAEMERVKSLLGVTIAENAWRRHQIGWYLLRTGKADEAKQFFMRAQQLFDGDENKRGGADPTRGLFLIALLNGSVEEATKYAADMGRRNPKDYAIAELVREIKTWPQEHWFTQMVAFYGDKLPETVNRFADQYPQEVSESQIKAPQKKP
jgi:tetratricopeptide (TPR) repeat protein